MGIDGLDEVQDRLEDMKESAEELDGENEVPLDEVFSADFMQKYTDFDSIEEFFEVSPWTVESEEDLEAIPQDGFDEYIAENTVFSDDEEMQSKAGEEWAADQIGF
jgi:hypothetical protein